MDAISNVLKGGYNKSFQHSLVIHLARCEELAKTARAEMAPSDFTLPIHQALWEVASEHLGAFGSLPEPPMYPMLLANLLENREGQYKSYVSQEELPAMVDLLDALSRSDNLSPDYFAAHISKYVKWVRTMKVLAENRSSVERGGDPSQMVRQLAEMGRKVDEAFDTKSPLSSVSENPEFPLTPGEIVRVSTGLCKLDRLLDGGPRLMDLLMVTACPGVGKSNLLLHMCVAANLCGWRTLFVTLELPAWLVKHRYMAMIAGLSGATIKKPVSEWSDLECARLGMLMNPSYPLFDMMTIADGSDRLQPTDRVEGFIVKWKEDTRKKYGAAAEKNCVLVSCDWNKYMVPNGFNARMDQWEKVTKINEDLKHINKRQNIVTWTANQGKQSANRKTVLEQDDTAFGFHTNDPLDTGIGAGLTADSRPTVDDVDDDMVAVKHRKLALNVNKNRNGNLGLTTVYQGSTLRFFDTEHEFHSYWSNIDACAMDSEALYRISMNKAISSARTAGLPGREV